MICTGRSRPSPAWTPCDHRGQRDGGGRRILVAVTGDLVLAAESASFTMAYTQAGLSPDGSAPTTCPG